MFYSEHPNSAHVLQAENIMFQNHGQDEAEGFGVPEEFCTTFDQRWSFPCNGEMGQPEEVLYNWVPPVRLGGGG